MMQLTRLEVHKRNSTTLEPVKLPSEVGDRVLIKLMAHERCHKFCDGWEFELYVVLEVKRRHARFDH